MEPQEGDPKVKPSMLAFAYPALGEGHQTSVTNMLPLRGI